MTGKESQLAVGCIVWYPQPNCELKRDAAGIVFCQVLKTTDRPPSLEADPPWLRGRCENGKLLGLGPLFGCQGAVFTIVREQGNYTPTNSRAKSTAAIASLP